MDKRWLRFLLIGLGLAAAVPAIALGQDVVTHNSWWLPPNASTEGVEVDFLFNVIFVLTNVLMIAVFAVLIYFLVKYRNQPRRKAAFIHGHHKTEVIWTITPAIVLVVMGILSIRVWGHMRLDRPDPNKTAVTEVEVLAQQFQWNIRYPGADGRMGTRDDIGTFDPSDQEKMPIVSMVHVPVNRTVRIHLLSRDVLHSFFLPNMRTKLDAVPGLRGELWFTPNQVGKFEIACAELCGPQHYTMRGVLEVMSEEAYAKWLKEKEDEVREQIGEEETETEEESESTEKEEDAETKSDDKAASETTEEQDKAKTEEPEAQAGQDDATQTQPAGEK